MERHSYRLGLLLLLLAIIVLSDAQQDWTACDIPVGKGKWRLAMKLFTRAMKHSQAQSYCESQDGNLSTTRVGHELQCAKTVLARKACECDEADRCTTECQGGACSCRVWVGLKRLAVQRTSSSFQSQNWRWTSLRPSIIVQDLRWRHGEPTDDNSQLCGYLWPEKHGLGDFFCNEKLSFLCQKLIPNAPTPVTATSSTLPARSTTKTLTSTLQTLDTTSVYHVTEPTEEVHADHDIPTDQASKPHRVTSEHVLPASSRTMSPEQQRITEAGNGAIVAMGVTLAVFGLAMLVLIVAWRSRSVRSSRRFFPELHWRWKKTRIWSQGGNQQRCESATEHPVPTGAAARGAEPTGAAIRVQPRAIPVTSNGGTGDYDNPMPCGSRRAPPGLEATVIPDNEYLVPVEDRLKLHQPITLANPAAAHAEAVLDHQYENHKPAVPKPLPADRYTATPSSIPQIQPDYSEVKIYPSKPARQGRRTDESDLYDNAKLEDYRN
ncbi:uncharacterized protein LOC135819271 isoform X1 [Sycon ciliatum]|uniref:uncharacterized protein LOC135819271 isoform X1 n=1 Tax=Sycon ciliatum TaxID=27933 RepID=UPI0031F6C4BE